MFSKKSISLFLVITLVIILLPISVRASDISWKTLDIGVAQAGVNDGTNTLKTATYGNGKYVLVGAQGKIFTSVDFLSWENHSIVSEHMLNSVIFQNGLFIAFGTGGLIVTSTNGINWTTQTTGITSAITAMAYGNGRYVATCDTSILTSTDGIQWDVVPGLGTIAVKSVIYGLEKFIVVGSSGLILTSVDGVAWVNRSDQGSSLNLFGVAYGNGEFVSLASSGSNIITSKDGEVWQLKTVSLTFLSPAIVFGEGTFVIVNSFRMPIYSSSDLVNFDTWASPNPNSRGISYCNGMFITGDRNGYLNIGKLNLGSTGIEGTIQATVVSFTVPTTVGFSINPSETTAETKFTSTQFLLSNTCNAPLQIEVGELNIDPSSAYKAFTDIMPGDITNWSLLRKSDSMTKIALGLKATNTSEWRVLSRLDNLYAKEVSTPKNIGSMDPLTSVTFKFEAKHGNSFDKAIVVKYRLVFLLGLLE